MARKTLLHFEGLSGITMLPDSVWLITLTTLDTMYENVELTEAGADTSKWDVLLEVVQTTEPPAHIHAGDPQKFRRVCSHVIRAERMFETIMMSGMDLPQISKHFADVELAVCAIVGEVFGATDYQVQALENLGKAREVDEYVNYAGLLRDLGGYVETRSDELRLSTVVDRIARLAEKTSGVVAEAARLAWGEYLIGSDQVEKGLAVFKETIKKAPEEFVGYVALGVALVDADHEDEAIPYLKKAYDLARERKLPPVIATAGQYLIDLEALTEEELEQALEEAEQARQEIREERRLDRVIAEHPEYAKFFEGDEFGEDDTSEEASRARAHLYIHAAVEEMLGSGEVPEMIEVAARLEAGGLSAHEVVHRLAGPVAQQIYSMGKKKLDFNKQAFVKSIKKLRP
jgi:tetratricopeptide (TPR) repeat protein